MGPRVKQGKNSSGAMVPALGAVLLAPRRSPPVVLPCEAPRPESTEFRDSTADLEEPRPNEFPIFRRDEIG